MLRSENARLPGNVYVDIRGRDLSGAVQDMQRAVEKTVALPPGYSISWSGQFEFLERATAKLKVAVILAGLRPIMWGAGTGSEAMQRIAACRTAPTKAATAD
jgi:Cu/Ag efflux pump CusA